MNTIRIFLSLCFLTGLAAAQGSYQRLDTADFIDNPEFYQGRLVEVSAEVVSVNADGKTIHLFDAQKKALIGVSLTQLDMQLRSALLREPVHRLSVYGRVGMSDGRAIIDAHRVEAYPADVIASPQLSFLKGYEGNKVRPKR